MNDNNYEYTAENSYNELVCLSNNSSSSIGVI